MASKTPAFADNMAEKWCDSGSPFTHLAGLHKRGHHHNTVQRKASVRTELTGFQLRKRKNSDTNILVIAYKHTLF